MLTRCSLLAFAAVLSLAFAPAPFPKTEHRSKLPGPDMVGEWQGLTVTPTRFSYAPTCTYALRCDPRARPATYDITGIAEGGTNGSNWLGIYKVENDVLTVCYNPENAGRPTAFEGQGRGAHTEVYRRRIR